MGRVILGTEAVAGGLVTAGQLRYGYRRLYPNVYVPRHQPPSLTDNAIGAWLWSGRRGIVTGRAAARLHGALWVSEQSPVELNFNCRRPPAGIIARNERVGCDEVIQIGDLAATTVHRTAFDVGRFLPLDAAVESLDALANATGLAPERVKPLTDQYSGARGMKTLRKALDLMDGGAESPQETRLRLLLMKHFPRPTTQIPVLDEHGVQFARVDMGWEDLMIAVEYDGKQHQTDRDRYVRDQRRVRRICRRGWLHIKVIAEDRPFEIIERVRAARASRERAFLVARSAS
ncbi:hypothetical protein [Mycolicibacterium sp. OfavD-34-C]|uniref:hypothetical protein n=1 Tax=Mycolicibacterium sp. OfavD-34-C TaxID=2917746 RepID=UPI001EF6ABDA|nr:hypothetical protein [Mycolicibacterium sp. OfavD-34-C]MCG7580046.1 hypothetical protein [Mycolicibacterium sp. OfavD-34-C]